MGNRALTISKYKAFRSEVFDDLSIIVQFRFPEITKAGGKHCRDYLHEFIDAFARNVHKNILPVHQRFHTKEVIHEVVDHFIRMFGADLNEDSIVTGKFIPTIRSLRVGFTLEDKEGMTTYADIVRPASILNIKESNLDLLTDKEDDDDSGVDVFALERLRRDVESLRKNQKIAIDRLAIILGASRALFHRALTKTSITSPTQQKYLNIAYLYLKERVEQTA